MLLFLNISGPELIVVLIPVLLIIFCLIDIVRSDFKDNTTKLLWIIIVLVAPLLGSLLYLLFGRKQRLLPH